MAGRGTKQCTRRQRSRLDTLTPTLPALLQAKNAIRHLTHLIHWADQCLEQKERAQCGPLAGLEAKRLEHAGRGADLRAGERLGSSRWHRQAWRGRQAAAMARTPGGRRGTSKPPKPPTSVKSASWARDTSWWDTSSLIVCFSFLRMRGQNIKQLAANPTLHGGLGFSTCPGQLGCRDAVAQLAAAATAPSALTSGPARVPEPPPPRPRCTARSGCRTKLSSCCARSRTAGGGRLGREQGKRPGGGRGQQLPPGWARRDGSDWGCPAPALALPLPALPRGPQTHHVGVAVGRAQAAVHDKQLLEGEGQGGRQRLDGGPAPAPGGKGLAGRVAQAGLQVRASHTNHQPPTNFAAHAARIPPTAGCPPAGARIC